MVLDPTAAAVVNGMRALGYDGFAKLGVERSRMMMDRDSAFMRGPAVDVVEERLLGAAGVPVRMYRPGGASAGVIAFLHGGGWVMGSLDSHDALCRHLADTCGATVIAVDYRLAPEHPFPAAVDDAWEVVRWLLEHGRDLSVDPHRIAVVGDSAGGNLAATVAQLARDAGHQLALQVLIYPVIDRRLDRPSMLENATGFVLEQADVAWFWDQYDPEGRAAGDPRAEPSAGRLAGLAPAVVVTAEYDPLRDEGEEYATRLRDAGVATSLHRFDGMFHGFAAAPGFLEAGDRALGLVTDALRAALTA